MGPKSQARHGHCFDLQLGLTVCLTCPHAFSQRSPSVYFLAHSPQGQLLLQLLRSMRLPLRALASSLTIPFPWL